MKYLIFDFDGVIANTFEAYVQFYAEQRKISPEKSTKFIINHVLHNNRPTLIKTVIKNLYLPKLESVILKRQNTLNTDLLNNLRQIKYPKAIVSRNNTKLIKILLSIDQQQLFNYIFGYNNSKSKVAALSYICLQNKVQLDDILFVTDTVGDVIELTGLGTLKKDQILGVTWGFHSRNLLETVLPSAQIMDTNKQLINTIAKICSNT
ncbi:HAD family hydrolase [Candidatus Gracilibacteria bacterium]|nr:HAD family hydrolase [Candidatus Gracilibacteria bacterium]NJS40983.1 HAD family hydrolase [Candidatus Gracilibacteria bacterium]